MEVTVKTNSRPSLPYRLLSQRTLQKSPVPHRRVKPEVANVAGDDLFLLEGLRNTECVVDHRLLDRVHLRDK